jgi:hypothetical protein
MLVAAWDFLMKCAAFCGMLLWCVLQVRFDGFVGRYEMSSWEFMLVWPWWDFLVRFDASWWGLMLLWVVTSFAYEIWCVFGPYGISCFFGRSELLCVWGFMLFWLFWDALMRFPAFLVAECFFWWCAVRVGGWAVERWMLKDAGEWVYTMINWTLRVVLYVEDVVRCRGLVSVVKVWLVQVGVRSETEVFVRKLCDSCHEHAWHEIDAYVWGCRKVTWTCSCD